jgi:hypothetical protein
VKFYCNDQTPHHPQGFAYIDFDDDEAEHLGPRGTRIGVFPGPEKDTYIIKPTVNSRSRLHPKKRVEGWWRVNWNQSNGWPKTGMTDLPYSKLDIGFLIMPFQAKLREMAHGSSPTRARRKPVETQSLPLDLPGPYMGKAPSKELMNRSMVGAPATVQDLKDALDILNDVLMRLPDNMGVCPYVVSPQTADQAPKVRATVTTKVEL